VNRARQPAPIEAAIPSDRYILLSPDKFKGSLRASQVAEHLAAGIADFRRSVPVRELPVADGGEGTLDAAIAAGYSLVPVEVNGPTLEPVVSGFACRDGTAIVELADACGLRRLPDGKPAPLTASTAGAGELVRAALDRGCLDIVLGVGGSCSTDGGMGLAWALGVRFLDESGRELAPGGRSLPKIARVDVSGLDQRLRFATLTVAYDVDNPLLGEVGAAAVYGPQKGATTSDIRLLETGLRNLVGVVNRDLGRDPSRVPGAGSAGGVGYAALALLGARVRSGISVLLSLLDFDAALAHAQLVVTGEGSLDRQSLHGKAPVGVAHAANRADVPVVAVAGQLSVTAAELSSVGIAAAWSLQDLEPDLDRCVRDAAVLVERLAREQAGTWLRMARHDSHQPVAVTEGEGA
jgi:glycerate kinase